MVLNSPHCWPCLNLRWLWLWQNSFRFFLKFGWNLYFHCFYSVQKCLILEIEQIEVWADLKTIVLGWVPLKQVLRQGPQRKQFVKVVIPEDTSRGERTGGGEGRAPTWGWVIKQVTAMGSWSLVALRGSGTCAEQTWVGPTVGWGSGDINPPPLFISLVEGCIPHLCLVLGAGWECSVIRVTALRQGKCPQLADFDSQKWVIRGYGWGPNSTCYHYYVCPWT